MYRVLSKILEPYEGIVFRDWVTFQIYVRIWPESEHLYGRVIGALSGVYTSNLLNGLEFYLGQIMSLYEAWCTDAWMDL